MPDWAYQLPQIIPAMILKKPNTMGDHEIVHN